jgi:uncharacterized protein YukE
LPRVLSTDAARSAIASLSAIINGGLTDQINQLDQQGRRLSEPDVWDGSLAAQFRSAWPQTSRSLQTVRSELDELRQRIERINADIMMAGGE